MAQVKQVYTIVAKIDCLCTLMNTIQDTNNKNKYKEHFLKIK